jgi:type I restriction enzyme, R subunit
MAGRFTESEVEDAALAWFGELGYMILYGPDIEPEGPTQEREGFGDVVLMGRLHTALRRINPDVPAEAIEQTTRQIMHTTSPSLVEQNRRFHHFLVNGVAVEHRTADGSIRGYQVRLVDFTSPEQNDWLVVSQLTVIEGKRNRRPDIVVFVNGLPLAVIELKNPADENATIRGAYNQLQTYQHDIPSLFPYNEALVVSDGLEARLGALTSEWERFLPWRTIAGDVIAPKGTPELAVLVKGVFERHRFLDLLHHFIVFEVEHSKTEKKVAAYHQFHAVNKAVASTVQAVSPGGDRRVGVVWHSQGSGKSLSMVFYAGKIVQQSEMANPTLLVITDRNDLDDQLFGTFARCQEVLHQKPVQAERREDLRSLLHVASGGVVFTTIQKFLPEANEPYPLLSDRRNIIVIADEAHRSQYDFIDGFARHLRDALPNASFIGFTGTPIESRDHNTPAVFGDYIDIYDIQRSVEDGATVRLYYEGRLAKLDLDEDERPTLDDEFEEITEGEEPESRGRLRSKWARLEAMVGADKRIELVAQDIVDHWTNRSAALEGKAMIVCMSRRICVALYQALVRLRPGWHSDDDETGALKVVMTGSASDPLEWQPHIRNKPRREKLAERFKDPRDPLELVIVRDMWLTGFDAPCAHTMYVDKPMRGHGLMQAIARVNRVFKDKPGGLVVDYLGLAYQLKLALADYTDGDRGEAGIPQDVAVSLMREKYEIVAGMFFGFDRTPYFNGTPPQRLNLLGAAMEHILTLEDGKKRYLQHVTELSKAFALAVPNEAALAIRDDVGFFQVVRALFVKATPTDGKTREELDTAIRQLVSRAVAPDGVVDIFAAAGLKNPDISILSDEFLEEVRQLPRRHLALELLEKLLNDQIKARALRNVVEARSFREMLERALIQYQSRSIATAEVIAELIQLAKEIREANRRGEDLGLSDDELAFYDALEVNDSAVKILGDETLRTIAQELVRTVKENLTIDWSVRESARARLRLVVKRLLRKYGYPPDKQEKATQTVIEQAEVLSREWVA